MIILTETRRIWTGGFERETTHSQAIELGRHRRHGLSDHRRLHEERKSSRFIFSPFVVENLTKFHRQHFLSSSLFGLFFSVSFLIFASADSRHRKSCRRSHSPILRSKKIDGKKREAEEEKRNRRFNRCLDLDLLHQRCLPGHAASSPRRAQARTPHVPIAKSSPKTQKRTKRRKGAQVKEV